MTEKHRNANVEIEEFSEETREKSSTADPFENVFPDNWEEQSKDNRRGAGGKGDAAASGLSELLLAAAVTADKEAPAAGDGSAGDGDRTPAVAAKSPEEQAKEALAEAEKLLRDKTGTLESTYKLLRELGAELQKGGTLEGQRLEKVREGISRLTHLDPSLKPVLEPVAAKLKVPDITGRTQQTTEDLNSLDESKRAEARRSEIDRLMKIPGLKGADKVELDRLRRGLFEGMRSDRQVLGELEKQVGELYQKQDRGQLQPAEAEKLAKLEGQQSELLRRRTANMDFTVRMLKAEALANQTVSSKGGSATQGMIMKMFERELKSSGLSRDFEIIPLAGGAMDDAGADFILLNKKNGDFMFIDPTQEPPDSERKARLPELRKEGIISSDPRDPKYGEIGSPQYNLNREADVRGQIRGILASMKDSPLNIMDIYIPPSRESAGQSSKGRDERLAAIDKLPPMDKALAIKAWRDELRERQRGLGEMVELAKEKSESLRREARTESDPVKQRRLSGQAQLLQDWAQHTEGTSRTHRQGSPLIFINRTLQELDAREKSLPEQFKSLSKESSRPGSSFETPREQAAKVNQAGNDLRDMMSVLLGKKAASPAELCAAIDRLSTLYGAQSPEAQRLQELKARIVEPTALSPVSGAEPGSQELFEKTPERLKKNPPADYSPDIRDTLSEILEANRAKWKAEYVADFEKLLKDYEGGDRSAVERVNKMLAEGRKVAEAHSRTAAVPAAAVRPAEGAVPVRSADATTRYTTPELSPAQTTHQQAIETLTCADGIKYIESIPIGELTVARVEEKLKNIDREIAAAKEKGLSEYAAQLEKIKKEYESKSSPQEKEAFCRQVHERMKEAHETAGSCGKGRGINLTGKAGTVVALLMVAGWMLDVAAPPAFAGSGGARVKPTKR